MKNNQLLPFFVLIFGLVGCATAPPETAESSASEATATTPTASASATVDAKEVHAGLAVETADTTPLEEVVAAEHESAVICTKERVTGSHFPQKVCRTRAEIAAQREASQNALNRNNSTGFGANSGGTQ